MLLVLLCSVHMRKQREERAGTQRAVRRCSEPRGRYAGSDLMQLLWKIWVRAQRGELSYFFQNSSDGIRKCMLNRALVLRSRRARPVFLNVLCTPQRA